MKARAQSMPVVTAESLPDGWRYPCTPDIILAALGRYPSETLRGISAVRLVARTPGNRHSYGVYRFTGTANSILLPPLHASGRMKLARGLERGEISAWYMAELAFGMRPERVGGRWVAKWSLEDYGRYVLEHVLAHEVGHHVCHTERAAQGLKPCPGVAACEQFAEHYALRRSAQRPGGAAHLPTACCRRPWTPAPRQPHRPSQGERLYPAQQAR